MEKKITEEKEQKCNRNALQWAMGQIKYWNIYMKLDIYLAIR